VKKEVNYLHKHTIHMTFEVLIIVVEISIVVCHVMMPCSVISSYQYFVVM
jgi:hypothetical protein